MISVMISPCMHMMSSYYRCLYFPHALVNPPVSISSMLLNVTDDIIHMSRLGDEKMQCLGRCPKILWLDHRDSPGF